MTDIFVFGSNLAGRHGKGAAWTARQLHGAIYGQGYGMQGRSFAIPTKTGDLQTLPLHLIARYVEMFKDYAADHPEHTFYVTPIGCGLAGYRQEQIRPMFAEMPDNCRFAETWAGE
jgi:hypothetical protein